ncbi:MAG: hypothetical protein QF441_08160 [Bacteriovoracaceae bacterium]|jgi:hypothetical protein|nr:hypothetical protein [Bacteriovoracaceae bacterium]
MKSITLWLSLLISVSALAEQKVLEREDCYLYPGYNSFVQSSSLDAALENKGYEVVEYEEDASLIWTYDYKNRSKAKSTFFYGEVYRDLTYELKLKDLINKEDVYHANGRWLGSAPAILTKSEITYRSLDISLTNFVRLSFDNEIEEDNIEATQKAINKLPSCKLK